MSEEIKWEGVTYTYNRSTEKLKVSGGYLYHTKDYQRSCSTLPDQITTAMCFVPCKHEDN